MYYARRITLQRKNKTDPNRIIINFIHDLSSSEMYPVVFSQLAELPGFVHKTTCLVETSDDLIAVSQVVFDTPENLAGYTSSLSTSSLTEYLISLADDANISVSINDGEIASLHV